MPFVRQCEVLLGKTDAMFWLGHDVPSVRQFAAAALALAEQVPERPELKANAMAFAARCEIVSGEFERATTLNTQAIVLAGKTPTMAQAFGIISLYLSGRPREAVELGRESVRVARGAHNTHHDVHTSALRHEPRRRGSVRGGTGGLRRGSRVRAQVRHDQPPRACHSFNGGMCMSLFDFTGAIALADEARDLVRGAGMDPPFISSCIDILVAQVRTGNPGVADALMKETRPAALSHPWHRGIWTVRLSRAGAEVALAMGDAALALEDAWTAVDQASTVGRRKYRIAGATDTRPGAARTGAHPRRARGRAPRHRGRTSRRRPFASAPGTRPADGAQWRRCLADRGEQGGLDEQRAAQRGLAGTICWGGDRAARSKT